MLNESCSLYYRIPGTPSTVAKNCYYYIQWAGHFICNPDFRIDRNSFESILLLYTKKGCGELRYRDGIYQIKPHSITIINCTEDHTYYPIGEENWDFYYIHFYGNSSIEIAENLFNAALGPIIENVSQVEPLIKDVLKKSENVNPTHEIIVSKTINDILTELLLSVFSQENDRIRFVCDYISKNYNKNLSTNFLAEISYFSRSYLSVVFKRVTGLTLHDYLLNCRINAAKKLLIDTNMSISEIAEAVGASDNSSFIRIFKKREGKTPLQYRKDEQILHNQSAKSNLK